MTRLHTLRSESRQSFMQMWEHGVDILEYQDAEIIRSRAQLTDELPRRSVLSRTLGFVLLAALLNSLFALAVGILSGTALESVYRSFLNFIFTFVLNTGAAFLVGRLLKGKASFRQFLYVSALYAVPFQVVEALLAVTCSLIPVVGFYLLLALSVVSGLARLYLSNLVTQAMMQFPKRWPRRAMFAALLLLTLVKGGWSVLA